MFSNRNNDVQKTELVILITPRVVRDGTESRLVTEEYRRKMNVYMPHTSTRARTPINTVAADHCTVSKRDRIVGYEGLACCCSVVCALGGCVTTALSSRSAAALHVLPVDESMTCNGIASSFRFSARRAARLEYWLSVGPLAGYGYERFPLDAPKQLVDERRRLDALSDLQRYKGCTVMEPGRQSSRSARGSKGRSLRAATAGRAEFPRLTPSRSRFTELATASVVPKAVALRSLRSSSRGAMTRSDLSDQYRHAAIRA